MGLPAADSWFILPIRLLHGASATGCELDGGVFPADGRFDPHAGAFATIDTRPGCPSPGTQRVVRPARHAYHRAVGRAGSGSLHQDGGRRPCRKRISIALLAILLGVGFVLTQLGKPINSDLSVIGQGRPVLVLAYENHTPAGMEALKRFRRVKADYEDRMAFARGRPR